MEIKYESLQEFYNDIYKLPPLLKPNKELLMISIKDKIDAFGSITQLNMLASRANKRVGFARPKAKKKMEVFGRKFSNFFTYCAARTFPYYIESLEELRGIFKGVGEGERSYARHFHLPLLDYGVHRLFGKTSSYCFFATYSPDKVYALFKKNPNVIFGHPKEGFCIGAINLDYESKKKVLKIAVFYRSAYLTHIYANTFAFTHLVRLLRAYGEISTVEINLVIPKLEVNLK